MEACVWREVEVVGVGDVASLFSARAFDVPNLGVLNPWSYKLLASSVVILTLVLKPRRPFEPVKGRWTKSPDFVLTEQDLH